MTLDLYTQDSSGNLTFVQAVPYSSPDYDPVLQTKVIVDGSDTPVANATVRIMADPIVTTGSPSPVNIGTGNTDGAGHVYASVDPTPVLNNPAYETVNPVVQLEVDYQTSGSGSWTEAFSYPEYIGGDNDPVLMTKQIVVGGTPVAGAPVQVLGRFTPGSFDVTRAQAKIGGTSVPLSSMPSIPTATTSPAYRQRVEIGYGPKANGKALPTPEESTVWDGSSSRVFHAHWDKCYRELNSRY